MYTQENGFCVQALRLPIYYMQCVQSIPVYITPSTHTQLNLLITVLFDQFMINLKVGLMNNYLQL